jgi:hypothetical protein
LSKEAMKLALEALEVWRDYVPHRWDVDDIKAVTALREALAQPAPVQEPVAWMDKYGEIYKDVPEVLPTDTPIYTTPPAPAQQRLTDEQVRLIAHNMDSDDWNNLDYRAVWHDGFNAGFREAEVEHNIGRLTND